MADLTTPSIAHEPYPSPRGHDQNLSGLYYNILVQHTSATGTHYSYAGSHGYFAPELPISTEPKPQYPSARSHHHFNPQHSSATETHYPSAGSHGQFAPELPTEPKLQHSPRIHEQS